MSFGLTDWLLTYLAHSTVLLGLAWLTNRVISEHRLVLREALWRLALVGGLITASLQMITGIEAATGSWSLAPAKITVRAETEPPSTLPATTTSRLAPPRALPPVADSPSVQLAPDSLWRRWLTGFWALGAGTLLALLAISYLRFRRRLRDRYDLAAGTLPMTLRRLERLARTDWIELPTVRLTATRKVGVALARGVRRPEICVPEETLEDFPIERHEIVLAHELAHLHRRDPVWFALTRILERLLFFQPLNGLARRRLQEISEFRCDDWAVRVTGRPISLAKCLTEVAERALDPATAVLAPTMAVSKTHLGRRVARLLKRSYPMPSDKLPRWLAPGAFVLLVMMVLIAPGFRASAAPALEPSEPAPVASEPQALKEPSPESPRPVAPRPPAPPAPLRVSADPPRVEPAPPAPALAPTPPGAVPAAPRPPSPALAPTAPTPGDSHDYEWDHDFELALGELASIAIELEADLAPMIADASAMVAPSMRALEQAVLAAEASSEWIEALDFDDEKLERLHELEERTREMVELEHEALSRHLERAREFEGIHREEIDRLRAETHRALEESAAERRELIERSRQAREQARLERERAHRDELRGHRDVLRGQRDELRGQRGELREEMLRMRHELLEQLRELDEELARDGTEGTLDRADEDKQ